MSAYSKKIPISNRPKLFKEMMEYPNDLVPFKGRDLFKYLQSSRKEGILKFKNYSEFLNIFNSLVFFFLICTRTNNTKIASFVLFAGVYVELIISAFTYSFLIRSKQNFQQTKSMLIFCFLVVFASKVASNLFDINTITFRVYNNIKCNFFVLSIFFLIFYDYYANPVYPSTTVTKFLYSLLAFDMSMINPLIERKILIGILAIDFFELLPEIRKIVSSYSPQHNFLAYIFQCVWYFLVLLYISDFRNIIRLVIFNLSFILIYPRFFSYCYKKRKLLIDGLWDLPPVTSYY